MGGSRQKRALTSPSQQESGSLVLQGQQWWLLPRYGKSKRCLGWFALLACLKAHCWEFWSCPGTGSRGPGEGVGFILLSAKWRSLHVSVQHWCCVWLLLRFHVRKSCRSLIKLDIRQRETRLILLTYDFTCLGFVWYFPFTQHWERDHELYSCVAFKRLS